jgi:hypothetical protein
MNVDTVARCEADLEAAYRALEVARWDKVPSPEMRIYEGQARVCQDKLAAARRPPRPRQPSPHIIIEEDDAFPQSVGNNLRKSATRTI